MCMSYACPWRSNSPRPAIRCDIDARAWHSGCAASVSCMSGWRAQYGSSSAVSSQQTLHSYTRCVTVFWQFCQEAQLISLYDGVLCRCGQNLAVVLPKQSGGHRPRRVARSRGQAHAAAVSRQQSAQRQGPSTGLCDRLRLACIVDAGGTRAVRAGGHLVLAGLPVRAKRTCTCAHQRRQQHRLDTRKNALAFTDATHSSYWALLHCSFITQL